MEGWTGTVSFIQLPEEVRGGTSRMSERSVTQAGPWGRSVLVNGEDNNHGWSRVRLRMVFSSFPFTCLWSLSSSLLFSFKGIPFLLAAQWFFFPLQLFLISQNHHVVCSSVSFYVHTFPFSVCLSVFTCLLFPSVFLPWYIFFLQLFSNTCPALLILTFPNSSFYSYHFSAWKSLLMVSISLAY